ncbi:DnaJ family domain-containing protein [Actinokineospora sp. NPDC004072]
MTQRKPANVDFEGWIEAQIRAAQDRGEFDGLPGSGKPLRHTDDGDHWWLKSFLKREELETGALLPEGLRLRKEVELLPTAVAALPTEERVRAVVDELNERIDQCIRTHTGPTVLVRFVDPDEIVANWRVDRAALLDRLARARAESEPESPPPPKRRWWRRR